MLKKCIAISMLTGFLLSIVKPFCDQPVFHAGISHRVCNKIPLVPQFFFLVPAQNQAADQASDISFFAFFNAILISCGPWSILFPIFHFS